jgi:hypothetical protein
MNRLYQFPQRHQPERLVRGGLLIDLLEWVQRYQGPDSTLGFRRFLPPDLLSAVPSLSRSGWYPRIWLSDLLRAVSRRFGRGRQGIARELGRHSAHLAFERSSRSVLTYDAALRVMSLSHASRFSDGRLLCDVTTDGFARMLHVDDHPCDSILCEFLTGEYEQLAAELGVPELEVERVCRPEGEEPCIFTFIWRPVAERAMGEAIAT